MSERLEENTKKLSIGGTESECVRFLSWNIAGIRASCKRGDLNFLCDEWGGGVGAYDIVCFQETKTEPEQIEPMISEKLKERYKYRYWGVNPGTSQRKGFSGVAVWSRFPCVHVLETMALDTEGRINALEFEKFILVNVYTPNSQELDCERFEFRKLWDQAFYAYLVELGGMERGGKPIVVCGDFNVSYLDIDMYNPKKYKNKVAGFLDVERTGFGRYIVGDVGGVPQFVDAFRFVNGEVGSAYTYWNQRLPHLRKKNIGWRLDYFLVTSAMKSLIRKSCILPEIMGSDHCPVSLEIEI